MSFFFTKNKKYWFETQYEPLSTNYNYNEKYTGQATKDYEQAKAQNPSDTKRRILKSIQENDKGRIKRTVWANSKYDSIDQEKQYRQGMHKERGNNLVEKRILPDKDYFVNTIRKTFCVEHIAEITGIKRTTVEHWFREDDTGFSYPSADDWEQVLEATGKSFFKELIDVWYEPDIININPNGKIKRTTWEVNPKPFKGAHFAVFPEKLIETPIQAGCPPDGTVLDPFIGSGTTAVVSKKLGRNFIGIELNPEYCSIANKRIGEML